LIESFWVALMVGLPYLKSQSHIARQSDAIPALINHTHYTLSYQNIPSIKVCIAWSCY